MQKTMVHYPIDGSKVHLKNVGLLTKEERRALATLLRLVSDSWHDPSGVGEVRNRYGVMRDAAVRVGPSHFLPYQWDFKSRHTIFGETIPRSCGTWYQAVLWYLDGAG